MNFSQLQERLRAELRRQMDRGTLSVSLIARKCGLTQPQVSNFLGGRGVLVGTLDKLIDGLGLDVGRLIPEGAQEMRRGASPEGKLGEIRRIPLVSHWAAMNESIIERASVEKMLPFPADGLAGVKARGSRSRVPWTRLVAIEMTAEQAQGMEPVVMPGDVLVLDRHYNSFDTYPDRASSWHWTNLYAVRVGLRLEARYVELVGGQLLLRPHARDCPMGAVMVESRLKAMNLLIGRVVRRWGEL